ncbi:unnamed protein product [Thelazia callipaeda]|uniref:AKAP7 n=1 Tax=Thelazia callipaeda TaxID=103827 RepID=A0A0N5CQK5_THECL|nr:unnamed protein product [Thelazia callipaeda]
MLQNHLSQCIITARTRSPDDCLEVLTEESDDSTEDTVSTSDQMQSFRSSNVALLEGAAVKSSLHDEQNRKWKSVHFKL